MNRRFYPLSCDIKNIVASHRTKRLSADFDQDLVDRLMKLSTSNGNEFFRPYKKGGAGLLLIYMSHDMVHLLRRYWQYGILLDATYRTTKYFLPFFQLVVQTNCGFQPVAVFVLETEDSMSIREALEIIDEWVPLPSSKKLNFIIDHSLPEMLAIEEVHPKAGIFFCDFHREQAWCRWVRGSSAAGENLLSMLRSIAKSKSQIEMENLVDQLRMSEVFTPKVAGWLNKHWLNHLQKWVAFFRPAFLPTTTNGVESLHRVLKHSFLKYYSDRSLHGFMSAVMVKYLPEQFRKYRAANLSLLSSRTFNKEIPEFLRNRPQKFVKHCASRLKRTHDVSVLPRRSQSDDRRVIGSTGSTYTVTADPVNYRYLSHDLFTVDLEVQQERKQLVPTKVCIVQGKNCPIPTETPMSLKEAHKLPLGISRPFHAKPPLSQKRSSIKSEDEHAPEVWQQAHSVMPTHQLARHGAYFLTAADFLSLRGNEWLTDSIMDATIHKFVRNDVQNILHLPSQTMTAILNGRVDLLTKTDFTKYDSIAGTYHQHGNHWTGLITNLQNACILYYDPFGEKANIMAQIERNWRAFMNARGNQRSFNIAPAVDEARQADACNCGIFTLQFFSRMLKAAPSLLPPMKGRLYLSNYLFDESDPLDGGRDDINAYTKLVFS
ncbi:hypothetical protein CAPTEDRAFT_219109 [Capitella teleta]|uniref:Ubiquitin-like protease family profile domain-containing protein n=1 Tax=Capitella teleta TaxID=283909 RepID=R7UB04_CAPTE|nr:hypothetical protein CAPTEDRAFT_219109 [Capitella teleta]|eukprot:ELU03174.1 hypothetical protein CAPTEDRAFT_219109 [Capitella teleta]